MGRNGTPYNIKPSKFATTEIKGSCRASGKLLVDMIEAKELIGRAGNLASTVAN